MTLTGMTSRQWLRRGRARRRGGRNIGIDKPEIDRPTKVSTRHDVYNTRESPPPLPYVHAESDNATLAA